MNVPWWQRRAGPRPGRRPRCVRAERRQRAAERRAEHPRAAAPAQPRSRPSSRSGRGVDSRDPPVEVEDRRCPTATPAGCGSGSGAAPGGACARRAGGRPSGCRRATSSSTSGWPTCRRREVKSRSWISWRPRARTRACGTCRAPAAMPMAQREHEHALDGEAARAAVPQEHRRRAAANTRWRTTPGRATEPAAERHALDPVLLERR